MMSVGLWDIAYNFLVGGDGKVYEGRGWDKVAYCNDAYSSESLAIAFVGNFNRQKPNDAAINAAKQLISCGVSKVTSERVITSIEEAYVMPGVCLFVCLTLSNFM